MKQTFQNARNDIADRPATLRLTEGRCLNVALVYQDDSTRQRARLFRDQLTEDVGEPAGHCTEWKIDDLKGAKAFSEGAAALARADLIVVSLYEAERLPSVFYLWVNLWLQQRSGLPGALVSLIVPAETSSAAAMETRRYLCAVANQGQLDLIESSQLARPIPGLLGEVAPRTNPASIESMPARFDEKCVASEPTEKKAA